MMQNRKYNKLNKMGWLIFFCVVLSSKLFAQKDTTLTDTILPKITTEFSVDLMSSYYWRGFYNDVHPNIQPSLLIGYRQFKLELWGSNNLDNTYREFDWTLSYQFKSFQFALSDYFSDFTKPYFKYSIDAPHLVDASVKYEVGDENVFSVLASCLVWGDDQYKLYHQSDREIQNYSTYLEASYAINCNKNSYTFLVGSTTHKGMYANGFDVVNIGFRYEKTIEINPKYSVTPLFGLWVNPSTSQLFFNCGLQL